MLARECAIVQNGIEKGNKPSVTTGGREAKVPPLTRDATMQTTLGCDANKEKAGSGQCMQQKPTKIQNSLAKRR